MTTKTQSWTPPCGCVFEEIYELEDPDTTKRLFFVRNVCSIHEPIVKNKPKLSKKNLEDKQTEILNTVSTVLQRNKDVNLNGLKNNPNRLSDRVQLKEMKKNANLERHALLLEAKLDAEESDIEVQLDRFTNERIASVTQGIISPYAFTAQEVYDAVRQEQLNSVVTNG